MSSKQKKVFYHEPWFWIMVVALVICVIAFAKTTGSHTGAEDNSNKTSKVSKPKVYTKSSAMKAYETIKIGNLDDGATTGSTRDALLKQLGKPLSTRQSIMGNITTVVTTWKVDKSKIVVETIDGYAFSKTINPTNDDHNKISKKLLSKIKKNDSYDKVISTFGHPDGVSDSIVDGSNVLTLTYDKNMDQYNSMTIVSLTNKKVTDVSSNILES